MNDSHDLDILVVYSAGIAQSASVSDSVSRHPFLIDSKEANYNVSYDYFLALCKEYGQKAGLTTSSDITGSGQCENYWTSSDGHWVKVDNSATSLDIFDKISPSTLIRAKERNLLLSNSAVKPFNDIELYALFFDKLATYQRLSEFAIPTVALRSRSKQSIKTAINQLQKITSQHPHMEDFSSVIILKDRFGAGGFHVYKIEENILESIYKIVNEFNEVNFIIQPYLLYDQGYEHKGKRASTDVRLIFHKGKLFQSYLRVAKENGFLCNEHQGGQVYYIDTDKVPKSISKVASKIVHKIDKPRALFALDFAVSNSGRVYFIEGNNNPGLDWHADKKIDEQKSKQLIRRIVKTMSTRINRRTIDPNFTKI
jgi:glutathione synthase/RimK-type ligase-like ATP-grasp enzyme